MLYLDWPHLLEYTIFLILNLWPLWLFLLGGSLLQFILKIYAYARLKRNDINEVDIMNGRAFEQYLTWLFQQLGYKAQNIGDTGDFGGDLIVIRDNIKTVVQAKRYHKPVGISAVQEAIGARGYYKTDQAIVVTNQPYTQAAKKLAETNNISLWDRQILIDKIFQAQRL